MEILKQDLDTLQMFIDEMNESSSGNHKLDVIKKYANNEFLVKIFNYTYNPYLKYGVHTNSLEKHSDLKASINNYDSYIFNLLDDLADNVLTGHDAIKAINAYTENLSDSHTELIHRIIDGDLRMGASTTSINKIIPGTIPTFKVALAHPYSPKRVSFENEVWYGSRKLDGVRCLCIKRGNAVTMFSRGGKEFTTLNKIVEQVKQIQGSFVLDGEICMVDENGNEDFQGIMKQLKRKNHTIKNPKFCVFDYLKIEEFDSRIGYTNLDRRITEGRDKIEDYVSKSLIEFLPQEQVKTEEQFLEMSKAAEDAGFEGIMLRKNTVYEGKRTHNLLKVKKFHDAEYKVLDCVNASIRWTEDGKQIERECLSSIEIEHKGNKVSVGSGFSKEQRMYYYEQPEELIGKIVTIQYFEESQNQNGGYSLRFPVVKHIYKNGRDC